MDMVKHKEKKGASIIITFLWDHPFTGAYTHHNKTYMESYNSSKKCMSW